MQFQYPRSALTEVEYDPEAEIMCQLEECQENIIQAIRRSTRREQFGPFMEVLLAVKRAQVVMRERREMVTSEANSD